MPAPLLLTTATAADVAALAALVNRAYRGPAGQRGWTTEAHLLDGPRTDAPDLRRLLAAPGASFLLARRTPAGPLLGSVYLQLQLPDLYLGMLAVDPDQQARGVGRQLVAAAEAYAHRAGGTGILITVISVRHELLAWYERLGFQRTGQVLPFPADASPSVPRQPLELLTLRKPLARP